MSNNQDELIRAYAILQALRKNIDQIIDYYVSEKYVNEFYSALSKIKKLDIEINDFIIPEELIKPRIRFSSLEGDEYTEEKYVEKSFILTKIDTVLGYLQIITSPEPKRIGYRKPEE